VGFCVSGWSGEFFWLIGARIIAYELTVATVCYIQGQDMALLSLILLSNFANLKSKSNYVQLFRDGGGLYVELGPLAGRASYGKLALSPCGLWA